MDIWFGTLVLFHFILQNVYVLLLLSAPRCKFSITLLSTQAFLIHVHFFKYLLKIKVLKVLTVSFLGTFTTIVEKSLLLASPYLSVCLCVVCSNSRNA
jgi:hypothetical protein